MDPDLADMIDSFFDFGRSTAGKWKMPVGRDYESVNVPKKPNQLNKREKSGTEYVKAFKDSLEKDMSQNFSSMNISSLTSISSALDTTMCSSQAEASFVHKFEHRRDLPIYKSKEKIINTIAENPVTIISGLTGCGKTTQVPQYILDSYKSRKDCKILVSQPRKIAAITIAQRVVEERRYYLRKELGHEVGYQVGLNKAVNEGEEETNILYCTTGVILQRLIQEKSMNRYTHIIVDEIHERDIEIDFLLIVIRLMMARNSHNTKIILMSATMEKEKILDYFKVPFEDDYFYPPIIDLTTDQRKFTIKNLYIEDFKKLIEGDCCDFIDYSKPGLNEATLDFGVQLIFSFLRQQLKVPNAMVKSSPGILVFLPGIHEIERFHEKLNTPVYENMFKKINVKPEICILHSSLSTEEQKLAFVINENPKVILSTNIAESSVTILNITHILDFCLTKYISTASGTQGISSLVIDWTSKNNCEQRAGRAGRVCDGIVMRVVSRDFFENGMYEFPPAEMTRIGLKTVVIRAKALNMGTPLQILALALDPPDKSSVVDAVLHLKELGGLSRFNDRGVFHNDDGDMTYLGNIMAALPVDVSITKFIILGYMFSVLKEAIIIGAGLSLKSIFTQSFNKKINGYVQKLNWAHGSGSDLIAILNAYTLWIAYQDEFPDQATERVWCKRHNLDVKNLREMKRLIEEISSRLDGLSVKELEEGQPTWGPEKIFILKICIAGAFGSANFFLPRIITQEQERDCFNTVNDLDIFRTVYYKNMDRNLVGEVYEKKIADAFISKGVIDGNSKMSCKFNPLSEKIFITFENNRHLIELKPSEDECNVVLGKVVPEVYKAVKLRLIEGNLKLNVMNQDDTEKYAVSNGLGTFNDRGRFVKKVNFIKNPEHFVEPTSGTLKIHGYVTHVDSCSKFFFRPVKSFGATPDSIDDRYQSVYNEIQDLIKNAKLISLEEKSFEISNGQLVIVSTPNGLQRGNLLKRLKSGLMDIYLMDSGNTLINVDDTKAMVVMDEETEKKLLKYPPRVFECKLKEIQPSSFKSYEGKWTLEAIEFWKQKVQDKKSTIHIYSVVNGVASTTLTIKNVDYNQQLIEQGFAEDCEESYLSKMNHEFRMRKGFEAYNPPEKEFKERTEQNVKQTSIPSPPNYLCRQTLTLKGPYSPLECELKGISRLFTSYVSIEPSSVNSVLLNDDILNFRGKFCVAADVTIDSKCNRITIRETTMMPNIPGLDVILALIFCPTAEFRCDQEKKRYNSVLTGLGFDQKKQQAYYAERDSVLNIDFELGEEDIERINQLRYCMSHMLLIGEPGTIPDLNLAEKQLTMNKINSLVVEILKRNRSVLEIDQPNDAFDWNVNQKGLIERTNPLGNGALFTFIGFPPLKKISEQLKVELLRHVEDLKRCAEEKLILHKKLCRLCNFEWNLAPELKFHLMSKKHRNHVTRLA